MYMKPQMHMYMHIYIYVYALQGTLGANQRKGGGGDGGMDEFSDSPR